MALLELTPTQLDIFDFARHFAMDSIGSDAVENVLSDLKPLLGSALVIGGLAVNYHGYKRYTDDADILYAAADGTILKRLSKKFKLVKKGKSGWHGFEHKATKVRLELVPEGGLTTYGFIPGPHFFGGDNGFLPLLGLVWLKLVAGRLKDDADIAELAKRRFDDVAATREKLPTELLERFDALMARVQRELKSDPKAA
jgi:hypothetical protein